MTLLLPWTELGELLSVLSRSLFIPGLGIYQSHHGVLCVFTGPVSPPLGYEHLDARNTLFPASADPENNLPMNE